MAKHSSNEPRIFIISRFTNGAGCVAFGAAAYICDLRQGVASHQEVDGKALPHAASESISEA
jgi:hypothetical protein